MNATNSTYPVSPTAAAVSFTGALCAALFILQRHFGYNLADGGFLWYGVQRTLAGDVPLRDFLSYDPGRYWLAAAFMGFVHDNGMVALRAWLTIVEAVGLSLAVIIVANARGVPRFSELILVVLMAAFWMYPEHKMLDIVLSISIIAVLAFLIDEPNAKRFFGVGVYVGLVAVIGRNHGMYGLVACVLTLFYLRFRAEAYHHVASGAAWGGLGILVGYSPMLIALAIVPGLWTAFVQSLKLLVDAKATNLPLPVPWPWNVSFANATLFESIRQTLIGLGFLALPLFALAGVCRTLFWRRASAPINSAFAAAVIASIPYQQYAFSRADVGHLAHSIFPVIIGVLCWPSRAGSDRRWLIVVLLIASGITMGPLIPRVQAMRGGDWQRIEVGHDLLVVDPGTARSIELLKQLDQRYDGPNQTMLVTPLWPGAYPLLGKVAPIWDIYGLFSRDARFENTEIERIRSKSIGVVVVLDVPVDGRDDLRFKNTHPLLNNYIEQHFDSLPSSDRDPSIRVYVPKKALGNVQ